MSNRIAAQTNRFEIYNSDTGERLVGAAQVQLPNFELGGNTYSGAGSGGDMKIPTPGVMVEQIVTVTAPKATEAVLGLCALGERLRLDLRADVSVVDAETKALIPTPERWALTGVLYKADMGSVENKAAADQTFEMAVYVAQHWFNGRERLMWDVTNTIFRVNGRDLLAAQRRNLGL